MTSYKRLGDYIETVDVRNKDLSVKTLLGVNIQKQFFPSIANLNGTDLSKYKKIQNGEFAYVPVTSRNGDKISIALFTQMEEAVVSQAYTVFHIKDEAKLSAKYLMMWFLRPEFDRYARYHSIGSAREVFSWEDMCDVMLPVPSIEEQTRIVAEYDAIENRIAVNKRMIEKLEQTAIALYRHTFVEGIDQDDPPEGWNVGHISDVVEITSGKTCVDKSSVKTDKYIYPVAGATGVIGYSTSYNQDRDFITTGRVGTLGVVNRYHGKVCTADNVLVIVSDYYNYAYCLLSQFNYHDIIKPGVQSLITQSNLKDSMLVVPPVDIISSFEKNVSPIFNSIKLKIKENDILQKTIDLLLSKMASL